ncbi:S-adenosyl-L-methionine-dependent methyltransferase [Podospora appendiculata]|uniref:S-adenosyl-L-methionine-dependent methyltransferase n=1 Tax=Podospora appendiculata TaxID=314037 RepID=A0AAE0XCG8_9PEZI|nr:S-adenosyl-L-methionine-dependent methyltransferase [Podospora appendiculata]
MSTTASIVDLSTRIAANAAKVNGYLVAHSLPAPSFDENAPLPGLIPADAPEVQAARMAIIQDTAELRRLMLGCTPREYVMSFSHNESLSLQATVRFGLAKTFPPGSETTFGAMAAATGVLSEPNVRQLVRHAVTKNIFREPRPGVVAHSSISRLLAEDNLISDWAGAATDDLWQAAAQTCNALAKYPGSEEPNTTGFCVANNTDKPMYEFFSTVPERARRFANAMTAFSEREAGLVSHVTDNYPWGDLGSGTVVDVGGSTGFVSHALARKFPLLKLIVQDLPPVIEKAKSQAPPELADRVSYMAHDFLTPQPVRGADVYFFRSILHNWPTKYCLRILRNHVGVLKPGARVVVMDMVLPDKGTVASAAEEERLRGLDLVMLELFNAHEREMDDWRALFAEADARFEFKGGWLPKGSNKWIFVAEWKGES